MFAFSSDLEEKERFLFQSLHRAWRLLRAFQWGAALQQGLGLPGTAPSSPAHQHPLGTEAGTWSDNWRWDLALDVSTLGLQVSLVVKSPPANEETYTGFRSWVGKIPGGVRGDPLQYSCLDNPRDRGAWWAAVFGVAQSRTRLKQLSSSSKYLSVNDFVVSFHYGLTGDIK